MRRYASLLIIFLFTSIDFLSGQANIINIRWGSTGDPLNGLTISWNNEGSSDSIKWGNTPILEKGGFPGVKTISITGTQFDYTFPAQIAGSTIHYAIFDSKDGVWNETRTYLTASDASDNQFSLSVIGDSRSYQNEWKKIAEAVFDTDFTLFLGDIISDGNVASQWDQWFEYGDKFTSRELVYHTMGNHDDDNSPSRSANFRGLYTQPGSELYYSFTYGNAVFICLYSLNPGDTEQYNWLLSTLEATNDKTWKIVFFHKPFYTSPDHVGEMDEYFNTWWKAFDDYGVDLIFNGHTHNYQRTVPINRNVFTDAPVASYGSGEGQGRCQIVAGSAGPISRVADPGNWWLDNSASKRHFCNIDIDGDQLLFKVMGADLVVFDSLELNKSSAGINFQVDLIEVTDLHDGGAVQVVFGARDSSFTMTDTDSDNIYTFSTRVPFETDYKYFFSYQSGPNPDTDIVDESVPAECSDAEGFRALEVAHGNVSLPAVLFGGCEPAPEDITFQVDLVNVTDLYDGGKVWLAFGDWDTSYVMTDIAVSSIFSVTVPILAATDLKYFFAYQNGADPDVNIANEAVPLLCGDAEGYRLLKVPDTPLILPAIMFGSCIVDPGSTISIQIANYKDDAEEYMTAIGGATVGYLDIESSDVEVCFDDEPQYVGLLFRDVPILPGSNVSNAYVQFVVDEVKDGGRSVGAMTCTVYATLEASAADITTDPFDISSRPTTTAKVSWSPGPSIAVDDAGVNERTPDLSSVIKEVIAQAGWAAGGNIMIVLAGDPTQTQEITRCFESSDGESGSAARLNVTLAKGTGIDQNPEVFYTSIYPNPTDGKFNIDNPSTDKFSYKIYSISGELIAGRQNITGSKAEVDMSDFTNGIYFVDVRTSKIRETLKLILQ